MLALFHLIYTKGGAMPPLPTICGYLAMIAGYAIIMIGLPSQIIQNFRNKSCNGLSPALQYSVLAGYTSWSCYGFSKSDWFLIAANVPGAVLMAIIVLQMTWYKHRPS